MMTHLQKVRKLAELIRKHGVEAEERDGGLWAMEWVSVSGKAYGRWVQLLPDCRVVLSWLGY